MATAIMSNNGIRPPRFGGRSSFSAWKLKVLAYLQPLGLKEAVMPVGLPVGSREEEKAAGSVRSRRTEASVSSNLGSEEDAREQTLRQEKAYGILLNLLEDELIDLVASVEPGNARGVWKVLLDTYEAKTTASLCHTLDMFMNIAFDGEGHKRESFDMYKARFTNLVQKLKEMGETVSPTIQRYVLLKGLPSDYDALVQSLKVNDKLTLEEVCTHIKDLYETNLRYPKDYAVIDLNPAEKTGLAGLVTDKSRRKKVRFVTAKENGKEGLCYTCGNPGHYSRECAMNSDKESKDEFGGYFA
jgi:hypothetical protein